MKITLTLDETKVWLMQTALKTAAMQEAVSLGGIHFGEYEKFKNEIDIRRHMVTEYMALRTAIMRWWAQGESEEEAKKTAKQQEEGLNEVVNEWNRHVRRIKGTA